MEKIFNKKLNEDISNGILGFLSNSSRAQVKTNQLATFQTTENMIWLSEFWVNGPKWSQMRSANTVTINV